jgi:hypothetical protein
MYKNIVLFYMSVIFVSSGCGTKTTSVSGTVSLNGKGLENIVVLMQPVSDTTLTSEAAFGKTDAQGNFVLSLIRIWRCSTATANAAPERWFPGRIGSGRLLTLPIRRTVPPRKQDFRSF